MANIKEQIRAGAELSIFIAAEFDWELKNPASLDTLVELSNDSWKKTTISQFDIELTLTKRVHPLLKDIRHKYTLLNEQALVDAAFLPKTYTIRLENGRFDEPDVPSASWLPFSYRPPQYALRLLFNQSPFPPLEEWKGNARSPAESCKFGNMKEFVDRTIPQEGWLSTLVRSVVP